MTDKRSDVVERLRRFLAGSTFTLTKPFLVGIPHELADGLSTSFEVQGQDGNTYMVTIRDYNHG